MSVTYGDLDAGYLRTVLTPDTLRQSVMGVVRALRAVKGEFDAIAVRGVSGSTVGAAAAFVLGKPLVVVRKPEQSHSRNYVEGLKRVGGYVIVDDFIDTGATVRKVVEEMGRHRPGSSCRGVALYATEQMGGRRALEFFTAGPEHRWLTADAFSARARLLYEYAEHRRLAVGEAWPLDVFGPAPEGRRAALDVLANTPAEAEAIKAHEAWDEIQRMLALENTKEACDVLRRV